MSSIRPGGDRGTSLAELTVTMAVFGIFATILATASIQSLNLTRETSARENAAQSARLIMDQVSKDIRTALPVGPLTAAQVAFVRATPSELVFYSSVEPTALKERLVFEDNALFRETVTPLAGSTYPDLIFPTAAPTVGTAGFTRRRLASVELSATGVFTYYLAGSSTPSTTVAAADLGRIDAVGIRVAVDEDGAGRLAPVVLESTVRPYNL